MQRAWEVLVAINHPTTALPIKVDVARTENSVWAAQEAAFFLERQIWGAPASTLRPVRPWCGCQPPNTLNQNSLRVNCQIARLAATPPPLRGPRPPPSERRSRATPAAAPTGRQRPGEGARNGGGVGGLGGMLAG